MARHGVAPVAGSEDLLAFSPSWQNLSWVERLRQMAADAQRFMAFAERSRLPAFAVMSNSESPLADLRGS